MKKIGNWKITLLPALGMTLLVALASVLGLLHGFDNRFYDFAMRTSSKTASEKIVIVTIDEASINSIGRWPWTRDVHAQLIDLLRQSGARLVGYTVFFSEPQLDPGLTTILQARKLLAGNELSRIRESTDGQKLLKLLEDATEKLDSDRRLANAIAATNNTVLATNFSIARREDKLSEQASLPDFLTRSKLAATQRSTQTALELPLSSKGVTYPLALFGQSAAGVGFANLDVDREIDTVADGSLRAIPLSMVYYDQFYGSLPLVLAALARNIPLTDIKLNLGEGVQLGRNMIPTDSSLQLYPHYYAKLPGKDSAFVIESFKDVLSGKVAKETFRDKLVLVGVTAPGLTNISTVPTDSAMPTVLVMAHALSSLLQEDYLQLPAWRLGAEAGSFILFALFLLLLLPRLNPGASAAVSVALLLLLLLIQYLLLTQASLWLRLTPSAVLLVLGYLAVTTMRFLFTDKAQQQATAASAESNRMLGLAFQSQGQLDLAFDKFRLVPLETTMLEPLYNLGLDFERKRQFSKAANVFDYIAGYEANYRDVKERSRRGKVLEETGVFGVAQRKSADLLSGQLEKPMLGRYQIEKELGKGAMGIVYQGRDPKINRIVAIKTLDLAREFDVSELAEVKSRFFREAETAGRLNHPHIVTIFDAGEEQDLAYIAMEFLKGQDLIGYTKPGQLLPLPKAMEIAARIAEALAYAHSQNVVHRDIKPANIMYEAATDTLKVTDFGIARITDASRTKTGMVLGTPSYMSPEQLAGKKIDGRSDLFSLAVMLYQLTSGQLPFQADSMTELMYKIANNPVPDILQYNGALPDCLITILNKALMKRPEQRYQSGTELAEAIRACAGRLSNEIVDIGL